MKNVKRKISIVFVISVFICVHLRFNTAFANDTIHLRAFGVPSEFKITPQDEADRLVLDAFRKTYPWIDPVSTEGLKLGTSDRTYMMEPLMQIAGDIAPDVLYVTFKRSDTYITMKLLHPLDRYVEQLAGVQIADGSTMPLDAYLAALRRGRGWAVLEDRVLPQCWPVMRRPCPFGAQCPYRAAWNLPPADHHEHIWCFPIGPLVMGIMYDRPLFTEHAADGVEVRAPRDWEELIRWAKLMTDPPQNLFGIKLEVAEPAWQFLTFLYSAGGEVVKQNDKGEWHCTLDSDAAVEAAYFYARLRLEKIVRNGKVYRGVFGSAPVGGPVRYAMSWEYFDDRFLEAAAEQTKGVGPVPAGPTGLRCSEFNAKMCGIFAGLASDDRRRDAAWKYIEYFDGPDARRIRTESLVDGGLGPFVRRRLLERFNTDGRYDAILRQVPPELEEMYRIAFEGGVPEPYGKNCGDVYNLMNRPLGAIWASDVVRDAIDNNQPEAAKAEIRAILRRATQKINEKMLGNLSKPVQRRQDAVAWLVITAVVIIFGLVMTRVTRVFHPAGQIKGRVPFKLKGTRPFIWLLMVPALGSIALWMYWPLLRGSAIAFQDYSLVGPSRWVGSANFAAVLFNEEFWYSLRLSIIYAVLFILIGFWVPIALAMLLQEVPRGGVVFRTIFYLPAVLSGVVVIFLWKSFYSPDGLVNQLLNAGVWLANLLPGVRISELNSSWLEKPGVALLCTLIPTVWVAMGPGCLIYLAALKTVPDELYEAADIDGAGIRRKIFHIALPSIRTLVAINFIGAVIGAVRGASAFVLAMTGGGPWTEQGGATEVIGLKIFYTTFGQLQFGVGAAMAWVLGSMLIGFTMLQLQRLSRIEFRTAPVTGAAGAR
jgi:multiple sugar transport system permease protein